MISCSAGVSMIGSSSFGTALVAGRKRVPIPAAGMTAVRARIVHSKGRWLSEKAGGSLLGAGSGYH